VAESLAHAPRSRFGAEDREREREREERERRDAQECSRAVPRVGTNATDGRTDGRACAARSSKRVNAPVARLDSARLGSTRLSRMRRCRFSLLPDRCNRGGWTPPNAEASFSCPRYSLTDYGRLIGDGREFVVQPQLPCRFLFFRILLFFPLDGTKGRIDEFLFIPDASSIIRLLREFPKKSTRSAKILIGPMKDCQQFRDKPARGENNRREKSLLFKNISRPERIQRSEQWMRFLCSW